MPTPTAKFASAVAFSLLAGAPAATLAQAVAQSAPAAADDCLSGPKTPAPAGSRWRYHIDRASKRHCWYLHDERDAQAKPARPAAASNSPKAAQPVAAAAMQGSVANAHAELPASQTTGGADARAAAPWPATTPSAAGNGQNTNAPIASAQRSQIASRWPGQPDAGASDSQTATNDSNADQPAIAITAPAASAIPASASDTPSPARSSSSIQTLLIVMTGALALAGLVGSAVIRFGRGRQAPQRDPRARWDSALTDLAPRPGFPSPGAAMPRLGIPDELRRAEDPDQGVAQMLSRLARSARA